MTGTDFSHLTNDELINGIQALKLPEYIRSKGYGVDVRETLAQMTEMTIQLGINMGLSPDDALEWARKLQGIDAKLAQTETELNNRIDDIIATPTSVSEQEIIDARQGMTSLGSNLSEIKSGLYKVNYNTSAWEQGSIVNGAEKDNTLRIRTTDFLDFDFGATVRALNDYLVAVTTYKKDGTYVSDSGWQKSVTINPNDTYQYKVSASREGNASIEPNNYLNIKVEFNAEQLEKHILKKQQDDMLTNPNLLIFERESGVWEQGTINDFGKDTPNDLRIRTLGFTEMPYGATLMSFGDYELNVMVYSSDETFVESSGWLNKYVIEPNTGYKYRFLLSRKPYLDIFPNEGSNLKVKLNAKQYEQYLLDESTQHTLGIEDYRTIEALRVSDEIKLNTQEKSMSFAVITDSHTKESTKDHFAKTCENINLVNQIAKTDGLIHLGDMVDGNQDFETEKSLLEYSIEKMLEVDENLYTIKGNHDDISYGNNIENGTTLSDPEFYSLTQRFNELLVNRPSAYSYFYKDFDNQGVRFIFLNSIDVALGGAALGWGYSQEQIDWFTSTALNTDNHVVVFSHNALSTNLNVTNAIAGSATVLQALEEWQTTNRRVVAVVSGHSHADKADTLSRPFPQVILANQKFEAYAKSDETLIVPSRTYGTKTEDLWNVMIIKLESKEVSFVRFGAGDSRTLSWA